MKNSILPDSVSIFNTLSIVYAQEIDLQGIEWEGEYTRFRQIYADVYQKSLKHKAIMWLAKSNIGEMVGQVFVQLPNPKKNPVYLHAFRVKEKYRGLGIGTKLMERVEMELLGLGYNSINLNVSFDNSKALKLYRLRGYQIFGNTPEYWEYYDENNVLQKVREPSWRLKKQLG
jgi:GNAT superfamily N-acetyltransferase